MKKLIQFFALMIFSVFLSGCFDEKKDDIKVGLILGVSGKYSNLGTQVKDGVILAFEDINYQIKNQNIKLILKNDMQNAKVNRIKIKELINNDVKIIIGNATSSMTKISLPYVNQKQDILLFSPTSSSGIFSNIDDSLIRLQASITADSFSDFVKMMNKKNMKSIFFIRDTKNKAYTDNYEKILQNHLIEKNFPEFVKSIDSSLPYTKILEEVQDIPSDLILIVANSIDTSNIIQYLRYHKIDKPIVSSGWARTDYFIENVGKNQKNLFVSASYDVNKTSNKFKVFEEKFVKLYNKKPTAFNMRGYETANIIIEALNNIHNVSEVKEYILKTKTFDSITGKIVINKFGDKIDNYYILKVNDNKFVEMNFE
jgi:branched-chain amino acid transport system substrate-binding protein